MCDLDDFWRFNHWAGHQFGDDLIKRIGVIFAAAAGRRGRAFRLGGEEFLVRLPGLGLAPAHEVAELIREQIAALEIDGAPYGRDEAVPRLTARFAVVAWSRKPPSFDALTDALDEALNLHPVSHNVVLDVDLKAS